MLEEGTGSVIDVWATYGSRMWVEDVVERQVLKEVRRGWREHG